jgi:hypothetical protein
MDKRLTTPARFLAALVLAGLLVIGLRPALLERLGVSFHDRWFLDSYAILAANDAVRTGVTMTDSNPLDLLGRPHVYSDWWLGLRWLGLTRADNFLFGGFCAAAFLAVAAAGARPRTYAAAAWLAAVVLAPPYLIALQRANNDLLIFALIGATLLAFQRRVGPATLALFGAGLVLATGLKYYPIVAAGALLAVLPWRRSTFVAFGLTVAAALAALVSERGSIGRGMFTLPQTIYQFGAPVLWRDLGLGRGAFAAVRRGWTRGLADETCGAVGERLMFAVGACLLVGCFLAGTSYIYRWIFGLWLWPWLWREAAASRPARVALGLWLAAIWADGVLCLVVNSAGLDYRPALGWRVVTQSGVWMLMALLAGWLLEGCLARWREWRAGT